MDPPREEIESALLQGEYVLVDGDLPTPAERRAVGSIGNGVRSLAVEWRCERAEAEREIFHRFAGRPRCVAEAELSRYLADAELRQPADRATDGIPVVSVSAGEPIAEQLCRVTDALPPGPDFVVPQRARRRVLLVEDDRMQRMVLAEVLRELDLEVELAADAGAALALLDRREAFDFDLVLSDQRMPGMSGVELLREIWQRHPSVRAVLLTAYGDEPTCLDALDAHALTVLSKPVHLLDLSRVLDEAA